VFCRRVLAEAMAGKPPLHLVFAIPDHPWADGHGAAAVRIAMTGAARGPGTGTLAKVTRETPGAEGVPAVVLAATEGRINADLTIGADLLDAKPLRANERLSSRGMMLFGSGFIVSPARAAALGLGSVAGLERHIRPYLNGRDLTGRSRGQMVIDLFGLSETEVRQRYPAVYQYLLLHVKPERDANRDDDIRRRWWLFGRTRDEIRPALSGLPRYIATVETAKHRPFVFLPAEVLPDNMLVCIASAEAFHLGVLNARFHTAWALAAGGVLEDRPRDNKTHGVGPFPLPPPPAPQPPPNPPPPPPGRPSNPPNPPPPTPRPTHPSRLFLFKRRPP
jgi:hypothetical protein